MKRKSIFGLGKFTSPAGLKFALAHLSPASSPEKQERGIVAFTLAEVLITFTILGIIAVMVIPGFIINMDERMNSEREVNIAQKITQAMDKMRAEGYLGTFETTDEFVDELQDHLKIVKRCDADHLEECWPTKKVTTSSGKKYEVKDAKMRSQLGFKNSDVNNVGIVLADGASLILTYDPDAVAPTGTANTYRSISLPVGNNESKTFQNYTSNNTAGLAYVVDVNGAKAPNSETVNGTYHDIRSFNGASFGNGCRGKYIGEICTYQLASYTPLDCTAGLLANTAYCGTPSGATSDYWAGANKACQDIGMTLPDESTMKTLYINRVALGITTGYFWESTENSADLAGVRGFGYGNRHYDGKSKSDLQALCVSN